MRGMTRQTVDPSIICTWLGVAPGSWPPDHYTLLGLTHAEQDVAEIERQVQQRLELVRRYQLLHPEAATEAMNRIAQAFVCLCDPQGRRIYDQTLFGDVPPCPVSVGPSTPTPLPVVLEQPPVEPEVDPAFLALVEEEMRATDTAETAALQTVASPAVPADAAPPAKPVPPEQAPSRRGLGTRRAAYREIVHTRALLQLWERAGRYLGPGKKRLSRPSEARALIEALTSLRKQLPHVPKVIGDAGLPGYLVVTLARQQAIVPTFQTLLGSQREALARDWAAGRKALLEHQSFLRCESRALRRQTPTQGLVRAFRAFLNDHPAGWLIFLGILALLIVLVRRL